MDDEAVFDRVKPRGLGADLDATSTSPSVEGAQGEDSIIEVFDSLDHDRDVLPRGAEPPPEFDEAFSTAIDLLRVHEATRGLEFEFGREVTDYPFEIAPAEGIDALPHDLNVLLRHRPAVSRGGVLLSMQSDT